MAVATYTSTGNKAQTAAKLDKDVFGLSVENHDSLKYVYSAYLANGRENLAKTKTRGDVRGGGRKPWRQKGTGRARFGSSRVPIWRGGGITFGPTGKENYSLSVPKKMKTLALKQALSLSAAANKIIVIESLKIKSAKTSEAVKLLKKIEAEGRVLLVVENKDPEVDRAVSNLVTVKVVQADYLNTYDVLNADKAVITADALKQVETRLKSGGKL